MAADIFAGKSVRDQEAIRSDSTIHFDDSSPYYWHLYRYFESARLPTTRGELIDLCGEREIDGYELARLREALAVARNDLTWRPESWEVVTSWDRNIAPETEIRRPVEKQRMLDLIDRLVSLIDHCQKSGLKLCFSGD